MVKKTSVRLKEKKKMLQLARTFPTLNISNTNLPGEIWKDIPGFEDEYRLSNYGRLRSQDRWINYTRCDAFRPGRIRKLGITYSAKNTDTTFDLQMKLHKNGKRYYYSVGRYVYYLFIEPFDLGDHSLIVTRNYGNGLNCHYENLELKSISKVAKEGFATENRKSRFQLQAKPVTQYSLEGKLIRQYNHSKEASEATGIFSEYINGAACTRHRTAGGYFWRYGNPQSYIKTAIYKKPLNESHVIQNVEKNDRYLAHHWLNRSIESIPGENWKDIAGFENMYRVSDFGRVKSLSRIKEVVTKKENKAYHWTRELIMKQSLRSTHNQFTGEPLRYLTISLKKDGIYNSFVVSRLVYLTFGSNKEDLDVSKVIHKDGDNLNNHISNLELVAQSEIIKKSYQKNRRVSYFAKLNQ